MSSPRVLLIEDDTSVREGLASSLAGHGYDVRTLVDGTGLGQVLRTDLPDVAILDVGLGAGPDGFELAQRIRSVSDLPVIFVTAADSVGDRVRGFEAGGDDYVIKPFVFAELAVRLRAVLRRSGHSDSEALRVGRFTIDVRGRAVTRGDQPVPLTPTEFDLLATLARPPLREMVEARPADCRMGFRGLPTPPGRGARERAAPQARDGRRSGGADGAVGRIRDPDVTTSFRAHGWQGLTELLTLPRPRRRDQVIVAVGAALAVVAIGLVDYATTNVAFAVFYLLPVVAATIVAGDLVGLALCALSSLVFAIEESRAAGLTLGPVTVNGALRGVTYAVVVLLISALRHLAAEAKASDAVSRTFLATAAHQLRTPVAGMVASAEALGSETDEARRQRLTENLGREAQRIGKLVSALLRFAQLDSGQLPDRHAFDVVALVRDEVEIAAVRYPRVDVRFDPPPAAPAALGSVDATREVLTNVLDNAARHAADRIDVAVYSAAGHVTVEVRDDGPGLTAGQEEQAFMRFVSLDGQGGAGLGLSIARGLAQAQGGDLAWTGQSFALRIPSPPGTGAPDPWRGTARFQGRDSEPAFSG